MNHLNMFWCLYLYNINHYLRILVRIQWYHAQTSLLSNQKNYLSAWSADTTLNVVCHICSNKVYYHTHVYSSNISSPTVTTAMLTNLMFNVYNGKVWVLSIPISDCCSPRTGFVMRISYVSFLMICNVFFTVLWTLDACCSHNMPVPGLVNMSSDCWLSHEWGTTSVVTIPYILPPIQPGKLSHQMKDNVL
jgi:hypothetical protein